jgi:NTE family protein
MNPKSRKRIGVALGGGVARGIAHIGVLTILEQAHIPINIVTGASVGSVVGSAYCAGVGPERLRQFAISMRWSMIGRLVWSRQGLFNLDKLENWWKQEIGDFQFNELKIPFAAMATDIHSGKPVMVCHGSVARAIRASSSVPGLVTPVEIDGALLADGNFSASVPVQAARDLGAEYVIGVDIFIPSLRTLLGPIGYLLNALEILIERAGCGVDLADCLISPELSGATYLRFSQASKLIALGEKAAQTKLPEIKLALGISS